MPALKMLGRKWHLGSDDFVFPGLCELLFRTIWTSLLGTACYRYYSYTYSCKTGTLFVRVYLMGMLFLLALGIVVVIVLICNSARGAIYDTHLRKHVPTLIVIKILLIIPEIALNIMGTIWTFTEFIQCSNEHYTMTVVEFLVCFNWVMLCLTIFGFAMVLDPIGSVKTNKNGVPATVTAPADGAPVTVETLTARKITRIWVRRFRWFFCWIIRDEHSHEAFSQIATLFNSLFRNTDLVPSDIITGCILLRVRQKRESREQRRLALLLEQRYKCSSDLNEIFADAPKWMSLHKAKHFLELSMAAYGWPFVMYRYCFSGCFKLARQATCCACVRTKPTIIKGDNCCLCNLAGVKYMSQLSSNDILYCSFKNHIFELPFCVMTDHSTKSIVISVRGSISMRDIFTDLCAVSDKFEGEGIPPDTSAHKGMLMSANYIKKTLEEYTILERAFHQFPEYSLVLTGHSLGAGVSVLLAFMLRPSYPDLKVFAFATPGGLLSRDAALLTDSFVMTVGVGDDFIMRLSVESVEDCRAHMLHVLQNCRLPKYRVFLNGFGYVLFGVPSRHLESTWKEHRLRTPPSFRHRRAASPDLDEALNGPEEATTSNGGGRVSPIIEIDPHNPHAHQLLHENNNLTDTYVDVISRRFAKVQLYTAGRILHITKKKINKEEKKADRKNGRSSNSSPSGAGAPASETFEMRWASCVNDFNELRIMPRMLLDHLPENVHKTVCTVLEEQRTEIGYELSEIHTIE
uniref:sn-1-specific diacylglycerol lipase n=1 Tax=Cacopsylla melanoneura TaxID=428564 RepID=A0A8D9AJR1_9HEMI